MDFQSVRVASRFMSSSPIILISGSTDDQGSEFADFSLGLSMAYPRAVKAAGGMPWLLPTIAEAQWVREAVRHADGMVLTGGDDVDPKLYTKSLPNDVSRTVQRAHAARDSFEMLLILEGIRQRKPMLCICRGHQIVNVALGGTLFADIPLQIPRALNHSRTDLKDQVVHDVECGEGSMLACIAGGGRLGVNSSHHQAVDEVGRGLRVTARGPDGVIEGLEPAPESRGALPWLLAVQFHPERLFDRHVEHLEIFRALIRACRRERQRRTT